MSNQKGYRQVNNPPLLPPPPDDNWRPASDIVPHDPEIVFVVAVASNLVFSTRSRHGSALLRLLNPVLGAPTKVSMLCLPCVMFCDLCLVLLVLDLGFQIVSHLSHGIEVLCCSLVYKYSRSSLAPVST